MSQSDSDEEDHKFELYETALKDAKNDINKLLKKKQEINYTKIVYDNLVYDPDEGIKKRIIEDLQDRDRKSTRLNSSHIDITRMPSSA